MKKLLSLFLCLLLGVTVSLAKNLKTLVVTPTPQMHCENCQIKIKKNLRFLKGVKKIESSLEKQTVTITYDADKIQPETIMKDFERFGYTVREVKGSEATACSPKKCCQSGCRK